LRWGTMPRVYKMHSKMLGESVEKSAAKGSVFLQQRDIPGPC
jgi:hypothetical protein